MRHVPRMSVAACATRDIAAPHTVDAEVLGVIRRDLMLGRLDRTAASQAVEDLRDFPVQRFGHRVLLPGRGNRATVSDPGMPFVRTPGLACRVEVPGDY